MALPLTPSSNATLNLTTPTPTPSKSRHLDKYEVQSHPTNMTSEHVTNDGDAASTQMNSPTDDNKDNTGHNQENVSPSKSRHSRILSGTELTPLKILITKDGKSDAEPRSYLNKPSPIKSPRKISPEKRFPVKISSSPSPSPEIQTPPVQEQDMSIEEVLLQNEGLAHAIKIFEDEDTILETAEDDEGDITTMSASDQPVEDEPAGPDDTMISTFSNFSAVPNLTMFARIGHSPTKFANVDTTPVAVPTRRETSPLRTPRPPVMHESGNTTNLLVDFTEQINGLSSGYVRQTPSRNQPTGRTPRNLVTATPQRQQSNLLDFDIPPLPTPRSIPTITPRELESLKSGFLSEISGLKASLSGKEAEVSSLKTAVGDAEKRVGECLEELREIRIIKETLTEDRDNWEKRGREMEAVLRKVKEEIVTSHREREELESKLEESEKRREAAEIMAQEAESKMAGMRAGKATSESGTEPGGNRSPDKTKNVGSREVEIAVERVARELHALYKSKHETKVTALKKSYENRWEKRVRELEIKLEDLADENEKLKLGRDATMTKVDPNQSIIDEERKAQAVKDSAQIKELNAEIEKLEAVVNSVKSDNRELRQLLERERVEKGELVMLAEEMMSIQSLATQVEERPPPPARPSIPKAHPAPGPDNFRSSVGGRVSGLRAPGSVKKPTESRIGGISGIAHERSKNGGSHGGIPRPGSGMGMRSGIMSSIEKMGNYRGRAE
ncbi:uncharacterized protein GGS22DRAFT_174351 [Annulohypoxylon maeteangense]|uniref:uncharacterized protein n=1 Tax=Annulohypoxylon maeteangense TaxID=1927788 RepID=UPI002008E4B5|nr:uncharacterized protein GGS22DRAFT_174351 [Annulohypoxylon maeteangense]KAI0880614.1 hypothetical protein GGS22DRAFT_174351 [Annulohypoxylon maeteangense]